MKDHSYKQGFTLIELLVVIAVLVLLMSILLPALAKSKELTRRVVCASNQKQITLGMILYAEDHEGYLANFTMAHGPNVHDVDKRYVEMMIENYHIQESFLFCPSMPKQSVQGRMKNNAASTDTYILGYYFWVPRYVKHYDMQIPPTHSKNTLVVVDTGKYWGPQKVTDTLGRTNPVVTDEVVTLAGTSADVDICANSSCLRTECCHVWRKHLEMTNQAFIDGRVEQKKSTVLKARYGYNSGTNGWLYR